VSLEQFKKQILLLHSEQSTLDKLSTGFNDRYTVHCATSGSEALNTLSDTSIDVLVTAQVLPGMSGLDALREARRRSPATLGILLAGNDGEGVEALVGANEVFQVIRGGVTPESLRTLIEDATRQARLIELTESANDTAADMDASAEHIVMETSPNGSSIITDATGRMPVLDPSKVAPEANVGSRAVDVLVLTKDEEFLGTVRESARGMHNIIHANTLAQADDAVQNQKVGVAVVDAAMVGDNVEKLTLHLRTNAPRLVSIVAGRRDDGEMLMDLINRGKVYRFLLKPVSPGRARLAVEASAKHHLEAPDAAFKTVGSSAPAAPRVAKPAPRPAPRPAPKPVQSQPAPKPRAKPRAKPQPPAGQSQTVPTIVVEPRPVPVEHPDFVDDALGDAFNDNDSSFTETMTGIITSVGDKFASVAGRNSDDDNFPDFAIQDDAVPDATAPADLEIDGLGSGGSIFQNPKFLAAGATAVVVLLGLGWWKFGGLDEVAPLEEPQLGRPVVTESDPIFDAPAARNSQVGVKELAEEAQLAAAAGQIFNPPGSNAIELYLAASKAAPQDTEIAAQLAAVVDQALGMAESSLLARSSEDAAAALRRVAMADPANTRLPFLNAQLTQMQLRDYLDASRLAIRDGRFEDAAFALNGARTLGLSDTTEIEALADELSASLSEQQVDDVLAKANARLDEGNLTAPSNDNARYYYELALSNDPGNSAALQGLNVVASKLVFQARTEIDAGRFSAAETLLADARRLDPGSSELTSSAAALRSARDGAAQQRRISEERIAQEQLAAEQAAQTAPAQTFAIEATAADALTDDKVAITPAAVEAQEITQAAAAENGADNVAADVTPPPVEQSSGLIPVAASALTRTKYVAPKYPRSAQRRGQSGWVEIEFTVDLEGSVQRVSVIASDPGVTFINAAVTAVEKWKFEPVVENNIAVQKRATVRMMFAVE
jgi:protein TonB